MTKTIAIIIMGALAGVLALGAIGLLACYQWIDYGSSAYLTRKTGTPAPPAQYAKSGQQGVEEQMLGPGRHFLNPWTYSLTRVRDIHVPAGYIGVVKSNVGEPLPAGRRLAESHERGTQRAVLTPGLWRINTFGMDVSEIVPATFIKPGYVGVQKQQEGANKGILATVLQAGYYNINPLERKIHQIEIGYRISDISVKYTGTGAERKLIEGTGVSFPLADGKQMHLDITVVWGIFPKDAPRIIREFGNVADVETKIIEPRVLSICKNAGSDLTTKEFIEGEMREEFQHNVTTALKVIGKEKGIHFLIALVRGFHPAADIKETIQSTLIAEEEKTTLKFEEARDRVAAELEGARRRVQVAHKDFDAQTVSIVEGEREEGAKKAAEIVAETDRIVAQLERKTAENDSQIVMILGQADADVVEATKKAEATRLQLLIAAYGGPDQYNLATFAESLPADIAIEYRYAGEGTFWTEAQTSLRDIATKKILSRPTARGSAGRR